MIQQSETYWGNNRFTIMQQHTKIMKTIITPKTLLEAVNYFSNDAICVEFLANYHARVDHSIKEWVRGDVHTNTMENFWSCFKRTVKGTYIQIASFHTDRYLDEQAFRYNYRKLNDAQRFETAMPKIFGKRLTYAELTGKKVSL